MPKSKTIVPYTYAHGHQQIRAFVLSEIGTIEEANKKIDKLKEERNKFLSKNPSSGKLAKFSQYVTKKMADIKQPHHQRYQEFKIYADKLQALFDAENNAKANGKKAPIDSTVIDELVSLNDGTHHRSLFIDATLSWKSPAGKNAVWKFTKLLLENDDKKFAYYQDMLEKTDTQLQLSEILSAPTPVTRSFDKKNLEDMARQMRTLEEKLNMTEGFHSNSSEYKAMKEALKAVNKGLKEGIDPEALGSRLETLQAASMDYVLAKGVGTQVTERGKLRMDAALDICSAAVDGMDYFASKDRREAVEAFEKKHFEQVVSVDRMNREHINGLTEVYKEELNVSHDLDDKTADFQVEYDVLQTEYDEL